MPTYSPHTLNLTTVESRIVSASRFGNETDNCGAIIMNYGFPGDSRNYDIAHQLSSLGYVIYIPHPFGVEGSEGLFTFKESGDAFKAVLGHCQKYQQMIGVVSYCYSTLWVLKILIENQYNMQFLTLAPILNWRDARNKINEINEGGFQGFLEQSRHGYRQGFYGVRCDSEYLISEYMELEKHMDFKSILVKPYSSSITMLFGEEDSIIDQCEIHNTHEYLKTLGTESKIICIPSTGHFFTMKRRILFEEIKSWANTKNNS